MQGIKETENIYQYDAFGNLTEQKEGFTNRILYTGQQYDQETGQYYLRAGYYNPVVGRFLQEDTYRGDGLNLYAYCANNPVGYYDPSGHVKNKLCTDTEQKKQPETLAGQINGQLVTNSAGQEVMRDYVNDQDGLLEEAEKAAGWNVIKKIFIKGRDNYH